MKKSEILLTKGMDELDIDLRGSLSAFIFLCCFVNMVTWFVIIKKGEFVELFYLSFDDNNSKCENLSK